MLEENGWRPSSKKNVMKDLDVRKLAAQPKFAEDKKMEEYVRKCQEHLDQSPTTLEAGHYIPRRLTTPDPLRRRRLCNLVICVDLPQICNPPDWVRQTPVS